MRRCEAVRLMKLQAFVVSTERVIEIPIRRVDTGHSPPSPSDEALPVENPILCRTFLR